MSWIPLASTVEDLDDLGDVNIASPVEGDMLYYDGTGYVKVGGTLATGKIPKVQSDGSVQWDDDDDSGGGGGGGGSFRNVALFRPYTVSPAAHNSYKDSDLPTAFFQGDSDWASISGGMLTDGYRGRPADEPSHYDDGYLGWNNQSPVVRIDLGSAKEPQLIRVFGATDEGVGIYLPTAVKLEYSDNDSTWTTEADRTSLTGTAADADESQWLMEFEVSGENHRYWRFTFTKYDTNKWIFLSEIEIIV